MNWGNRHLFSRALPLLAILSWIGCGSAMKNQSTTNTNGDLVFAGCYAPSATTSNVDCGLASTLGDPNSDAVFQTEVNTQQGFWQGIPATVYPWNDCSGANSISLPSGDILYGVNLFQMLVAAYGGDAAPISGVLAHEWGHQVQFDNGWFPTGAASSSPIELEADAFSGFYMALGEYYSWTSINNYFSAVFSTGDYNFNDPTHHGTPQQRLAAAQLGFQTAIQSMETGAPLTYDDLHQIFSTTISGFAEKTLTKAQSDNPVASQFLERLDRVQILDILNGVSHGKDVPLPNVEHKERLYPRKR